ncbi:MAG: antitoxin Xre-like helix-turn-helix domain-containing protein [Lamprobacter sp.]|uniref:antitoxin Xre-like helix-turn-helix domain-containing protein n=1 Tax=Lamprobacter sp. TaxID=3100796 RepID=UPI002B25C48A|nr:antitoxin Xre-like helix-turn-helix domain-containing protein [Lamprobacter sp.]MEA3642614.1 antitoxin Xre-like helix-turn-helix domain-containing protein [Lamprobacter sp.]
MTPSGAALRTFFNIADTWSLTTEQAMTLLGLTSRSTFFKWKGNPESARLSRNALERLSYIFGIYKALQLLLPKPESADACVRKSYKLWLFSAAGLYNALISNKIYKWHEVCLMSLSSTLSFQLLLTT